MFGWFRPRPPLGTFEKAWVERRMRWLTAQFGLERLRQTTVLLPTAEFFPDDPPRTEADVRRWMERVAFRLDLDPAPLELEIVAERQMLGYLGQYLQEERIIRLNEVALRDPPILVTVLAHELAHELLLGQGRLTREERDQEWVTDLLPVFFGFGVFCGNCTIHEEMRLYGDVGYWTIRRLGYLPSRMVGYALALFARARDEAQPNWVAWLRPDALEPLQQGLKYLDQTGDTVFVAGRDDAALTESDILARLRDGSPSAQLDALWEIRDRKLHSAEALEVLWTFFHGLDSDLAEHSLELVREWPGPLPEDVQSSAMNLIEHRELQRCIGALQLLAQHDIALDRVVQRLDVLLQRELDRTRCLSVLRVLTILGRAGEPLLPLVRPIWKRALRSTNYAVADAVALAALKCAPDPDACIQSWFDDPEVRHLARRTLRDVSRALNNQSQRSSARRMEGTP